MSGGATGSRSLLDLEHLSPSEIKSILKSSERMAKLPRARAMKRLAGRRVALLFYEASTRTRVSFEMAAKNLGAVTTLITSTASSIEKGESLTDTGRILEAVGAECVVMRHPVSGAAHLLAQHIRVPVLNGGDGMHEHPSQGLLDAYTMLRHRKTLNGLRVTITGDILHSRVVRSNVHLLAKFGAKVTLCGPPELLPEVAATLTPGVRVERDFDKALRAADVIMMLRVQKERLAGLNLDLEKYIRGYQLTTARVRLAMKGALVMHPGPVMRGIEITSEVMDGPQSVIFEQAANGVFVRMALLERALR